MCRCKALLNGTDIVVHSCSPVRLFCGFSVSLHPKHESKTLHHQHVLVEMTLESGDFFRQHVLSRRVKKCERGPALLQIKQR